MRKVDFPIRIEFVRSDSDTVVFKKRYYSPDLDCCFDVPNELQPGDVLTDLHDKIRDHLIQCAKDNKPVALPKLLDERVKSEFGWYFWKIITIQEEDEKTLPIFKYLFPFGGLVANTIAGATQSTITFFSLQAFLENPTLAFILGLIGAIFNIISFTNDYLATTSLEDLSYLGKKIDSRFTEKLATKLPLAKREKDAEAQRIRLGSQTLRLFPCITFRRKRSAGMLLLSLAFMAFVIVNSLFEGGTAYQEVYRLGNLSRSRGDKSLNNTGLIIAAILTGIVMLLRTIAFEIPLELQIVDKVEKQLKTYREKDKGRSVSSTTNLSIASSDLDDLSVSFSDSEHSPLLAN